MKNEYATVIHRWVDELWNKGNEAIIDEMLAPDCRAHGLNGEVMVGPDAFKPFYKTFSGALGNTVMTVEDFIVDGNKIAARCRVQAKHTGDSLGIKSTGKDVNFTGMMIVHINNNGLVTDAWNNFDFLTMYQQVGYSIAPIQTAG